MKKFFFSLFALAILGSGCKKNNEMETPTVSAKQKTATPEPETQSTPPTAGFKITNASGAASIWEGLNLTIENTSQDAASYFWDFGNGTTTSTEKTPSNIALFPCSTTVTIKLTVKNRSGQSATYSAPYTIVCSRGMGFGSHKDKTL